MKKIVFELNHPKHYLQYKFVAKILERDYGHSIIFLLKEKDVLIELLKNDGQSFHQIKIDSKSIFSKVFGFGKYLINYIKAIRKENVNLIVSKASPYAVVAGKILGIKSIITPDSEVVGLTNKFVAPLSSKIITPQAFSKNFGKKHFRVSAFFEDQYLHPSYFTPDRSLLISNGFNPAEKYALVRFVAWKANHDIGRYGFDPEEKLKLVRELEKIGRVYISSESELPEVLNKYKLNLHPGLIHQALHFADLYIGDSQTMATEAALLGTPAVRYNSFVGPDDMSNFIYLERKMNMLFNFRDANEAIKKAAGLFMSPDEKNKMLYKRSEYYKSAGDINFEMAALLNSYLF